MTYNLSLPDITMCQKVQALPQTQQAGPNHRQCASLTASKVIEQEADSKLTACQVLETDRVSGVVVNRMTSNGTGAVAAMPLASSTLCSSRLQSSVVPCLEHCHC